MTESADDEPKPQPHLADSLAMPEKHEGKPHTKHQVNRNEVKEKFTPPDLLAASDYSQPKYESEREWIEAPAVGRELL